MKQITKTVFSAIMVFGLLCPAQQAIHTSDFAFGQSIELSTQKSVVQILLPESLFKVSKNLNLLDLAISNSLGEAVPHSVLDLEPRQIEKIKVPQSLPVFPMYGNVSDSIALDYIRISKNTGSTVVADGVTAWFEMNGQKIVQYTVANNLITYKFYRISTAKSQTIPSIEEIQAHLTTEIEQLDVLTFARKVEGKMETLSRNAFNFLSAEFSKSKFQFWKLQLLSDLSGIGQKFPEISFIWQPHRLQNVLIASNIL